MQGRAAITAIGASGSAQSSYALDPRRTADTLDLWLDDNTATRQRRPARKWFRRLSCDSAWPHDPLDRTIADDETTNDSHDSSSAANTHTPITLDQRWPLDPFVGGALRNRRTGRRRQHPKAAEVAHPTPSRSPPEAKLRWADISSDSDTAGALDIAARTTDTLDPLFGGANSWDRTVKRRIGERNARRAAAVTARAARPAATDALGLEHKLRWADISSDTDSAEEAECAEWCEERAADPLSGGGRGKSAASGLADIRRDLAALAAKIAAFGGDPPQPKQKKAKDKKVTFTRSEQTTGDSPVALWVTIARLVDAARSCATPPTDAEVQHQLRALLSSQRGRPASRGGSRTSASSAGSSAGSAAGSRRGRGRSPKPPANAPSGASPPTSKLWSDVLRESKAKPPAGPRPPAAAPTTTTKHRLWAADWDAKIIGLEGLNKVTHDQPVVVAVRSIPARNEAELWAHGRAKIGSTTIVFIDGGTERVMLHTNKGPVAGRASVTRIGASPPCRTAGEAAATINDKAIPDVDLVQIRLTVTKLFGPELFERATMHPGRLPSILLPAAMLPRIIRTMAVAVYANEVTCLLRVRADLVDAFTTTKIPCGVIVSEHTAKGDRAAPGAEPRPQWVDRPPGASASEYWRFVASVAADTNGKICYRSGGTNCLGIRGGSAGKAQGVTAPRWTITGAPEYWAGSDVEQWLAERSFSGVIGIARSAKRAWSLRAWPPEGITMAKSTSFSSGIILAPALFAPTSRKSKVAATAPPRWGAAPSPPDPADAGTGKGRDKGAKVDAGPARALCREPTLSLVKSGMRLRLPPCSLRQLRTRRTSSKVPSLSFQTKVEAIALSLPSARPWRTAGMKTFIRSPSRRGGACNKRCASKQAPRCSTIQTNTSFATGRTRASQRL